MLIELVGAPGVGKSTLAKAVCARAEVRTRHQLSADWHRQSLPSRAIHIGRGFARPKRLIAAARLAFSCRLHDRGSIGRLLRVIAKSEWLSSRSGPVVLDQGFLQDLWSILYMGGCNGPNPAHLSPFLRSVLPRDDMIVVLIAVDPNTEFERIRRRSGGHSRFDGLSQLELETSIERAARLPEAIASAARRAGIEVVELDGSEGIDTLAEQIFSLLPASVYLKGR
jgi:hypothetical protein